MMMRIPEGFRFDPTDEELISGYLVRKATDQPLPWSGFLERNIYGKDNAPWDVFGDVINDPSSLYCHTRNDNSKKTIYVFTNLVKVGPNSKRIARMAGCGTWGGQTGAKKIRSSITGEVIGSTKMFQFEPDSTFGHWIMHEYSLDGVSLTTNNIVNKDLVLCKITRIMKSHKTNIGDHQERFSHKSQVHQDDQNLALPSSSSNNKRSVEELTGEYACDQHFMKKQRSLFSPNDDLSGLNQLWTESEFLDVDALLGGLDDVPLSSFVEDSLGQPSSICWPHQIAHP